MQLIAIDTTGNACAAAIFKENRCVAHQRIETPHGYSTILLGLLDDALKEANTTKEVTTHIAVAIGPGSFTGIRIGIACAQGIALALGITPIGITTLQAIAAQNAHIPTLLAIVDSRRGDAFVQPFHQGIPTAPMHILTPDALIEHKEIMTATTIIGTMPETMATAFSTYQQHYTIDQQTDASIGVAHAALAYYEKNHYPAATPFYGRDAYTTKKETTGITP